MRKSALVTGASRGIGRAVALALADNGYDVGINHRDSEDGAREVCRLAEEKGARTAVLQGDVGSVGDIDRVFGGFLAEFGHIDLLVNNAGITRFAPFLMVSEEVWDAVTRTNLKGPFFCAQRAARDMVEKRNPGVIINISSNQQDGCWPRSSVYGPSKAALGKLTRHMALELAEHGIRVNSVAPGYTTDAARNSRPSRIFDRLPLHRFATYEEVADAVVFLASDKAAYMTGSCLTIDGGALLPVLPENRFISQPGG